MARLVFHGQSCIEVVTADQTRILVDPFLSENPLAVVGPGHFKDRLDYLLLTHGHGDHIGDTWEILEATGAQLIATYEIAAYAGEVQGHANSHAMHIGGGHDFPFGRVKFVTAVHGGKVDSPGAEGYTTTAAGIVLSVDGARIYHAGDTGLTRDMELLRGSVDVALLPIGDNYTMGPEDAARAVDMIQPRVAIPMHYGTWELIDVDPALFANAVAGAAEVVILQPGGALEL